jgi:TM2 domain-containing membrane protein YozV
VGKKMPRPTQGDFEIDLDPKTTLLAVKEALLIMPVTIQIIDEQNGLIQAKKGINFKSYGESIRIWVKPCGPAGTHVTIQSELSSTYQLVDWGINEENIRKFASCLSQILASRNLPKLRIIGATMTTPPQTPNPPPPVQSNTPHYDFSQPTNIQAAQPADFFRRPLKDRNTTLILEILPGLFGIYGIGWMYANRMNTGVMLLVGGLIWLVIAVIINIATGGFACFCTIPVNIAAVALSATQLNSYTKQHPELFA